MIKNIWYIIFTTLFVILILRKLRGEKGTYNTKKEIHEYASIVAPIILKNDEDENNEKKKKNKLKVKNKEFNEIIYDNYIDDNIDIRKKNCHKILNNEISNSIIEISPNFRATDLYSSAKFSNIIKSKYKSDSDSIGENICRKYIEHIFKKPFYKTRPDFLKNPVTNSNLEIDCYSQELGLGIEYNGKQHYEYCPKFHNNKQDFYNQKYRDIIKRNSCMKNGISLIEVPYTVKHIAIPFYIEKALEKLNIYP